MAIGPDAVSLLRPYLLQEAETVQNVITVLGIYYASKKVIKLGYNLYVAFRNFVWARIYPLDLVKKYGAWAVVTGATDGIGKGYAYELARRGMKVMLIARNEEKLKRVADEIKLRTGSEISYVVADFSKGASIYASIKQAIQDLEIGILVNNVGVLFIGEFDEMTEQEYRGMLEVNNNAAVEMTHLVLPAMKARRSGAIVNISSGISFYPTPMFNLYAATKVFDSFFSRGLAYECKFHGITVQCVTPNAVRTNMTLIFSDSDYSAFNVFWPNPEQFAKSAVATIPYATHTHGYWAHALQSSLIPGEFLWQRGLYHTGMGVKKARKHD